MKYYTFILALLLAVPMQSFAGKRPFVQPVELIRAEEVAQCEAAVDTEAVSKCDTSYRSLRSGITVVKRLPGCSNAVAIAKANCRAGKMEVFNEVAATAFGQRNYETLLKLPGHTYTGSIMLSTYAGRANNRPAVTHCWIREPSPVSSTAPLPRDYVSLSGCPVPTTFQQKWLQREGSLGTSLASRTFRPSFMGYVSGPRAVPPNVPIYQCKAIASNNQYLSNDRFCNGNLTVAFLGYERRPR